MTPPDRAITDASGETGRAALWFGIVGAPAAWSLHLLACVAFGSATCLTPGATVPVLAGSWWILIAISGAALTIAGASVWVAARAALGARARRSRFMASAGVLLGAVFLTGVAFNVLPLFLVPICG